MMHVIRNRHIYLFASTGSYSLVISCQRCAIGIYWYWRPVPRWYFWYDAFGLGWHRCRYKRNRLDEIGISLGFLRVDIEW